MKHFCLLAFLLCWFSAIVAGATYATIDALECASGCQCKNGGSCRCFDAPTAKCVCGSCNCEETENEQELTPLSEQEFEELKVKLRKQMADSVHKKSCCHPK